MIDFLTGIGPHLAYFILFLGACVEGESVVLTAGFLAYTGFLTLKWVMVIAFLATLFADQILFFIGHYRGTRILERRPQWKRRTQKIFKLLHRHNVLFILGFRFVYGIRTLSPLVLGTAGIGVKRFMFLNFIAAIIWTVISCLGGYLLGYFFADKIDSVVHRIGHYQKIIVIAIAIVTTLFLGALYIYRKTKDNHKKKKNRIDPSA